MKLRSNDCLQQLISHQNGLQFDLGVCNAKHPMLHQTDCFIVITVEGMSVGIVQGVA